MRYATFPVSGYTIVELSSAYAKGEVRPLEVALSYLKRAHELNPVLNAYITILPEDEVRRQALEAEEMLARGEATPLTGVPLSIKDNINLKGFPTTCASKILSNYVSPYDATVVERLRRAGAVIIGKTNLDEFAMGSSTENSYYGPSRNPFDVERVPGGSSGGSAVSVASDTSVASLGSDTGGSIRLPAAFCGLFGLKPTYGLVSRYGLVAFASSLDQIGPIAKTAEGIAILLDAISGYDPMDSTSWRGELRTYPLEKVELKGLKLAYLEGIEEGLQPEVRMAYEGLLSTLEAEGVELKPLKLKTLEHTIPVYYLVACSEASSNLARYDGVRYGLRVEAESYWDSLMRTRAQGFGLEVKRRIMLGTFALSAGYFDKYYLKASAMRNLMRAELRGAFREVEAILLPTSPTTPFKLGERTDDPLKMYLSDIFTTLANLVGVPAVSVPVGLDSQGLPIGMQLMGPHFSERRLISLSKALFSLTTGR